MGRGWQPGPSNERIIRSEALGRQKLRCSGVCWPVTSRDRVDLVPADCRKGWCPARMPRTQTLARTAVTSSTPSLDLVRRTARGTHATIQSGGVRNPIQPRVNRTASADQGAGSGDREPVRTRPRRARAYLRERTFSDIIAGQGVRRCVRRAGTPFPLSDRVSR